LTESWKFSNNSNISSPWLEQIALEIRIPPLLITINVSTDPSGQFVTQDFPSFINALLLIHLKHIKCKVHNYINKTTMHAIAQVPYTMNSLIWQINFFLSDWRILYWQTRYCISTITLYFTCIGQNLVVFNLADFSNLPYCQNKSTPNFHLIRYSPNTHN